MKGAIIDRRVLIGIVIVGSVSVITFLVLFASGNPLEPADSPSADAFSRSAVGHRAFVKLLERLDVAVTVSRHSSAARAGDSAVLVIAEPIVHMPGHPRFLKLTEMLEAADTVLLVLPKWESQPDEGRPGWVRSVHLAKASAVEAVLLAAGISATLVRADPEAALDRWTSSFFTGEPSLTGGQFVRGGGLVPLLATSRGVLLGEVRRENGRLLVLTDPDVISNHGIARGDNALLVVKILDELRSGERPVIVDETMHGHESPPSVMSELFSYPLVLATAGVILAAALLLWAATGRFGAPLPAAGAIRAGKRVLIGNTAELLLFGGHTRRTLDRYLATTLSDVSRALHAPAGIAGAALDEWLTERGRTRGVRWTVRELKDAVRSAKKDDGARILLAAENIHDWQEAILDGSQGHQGRG